MGIIGRVRSSNLFSFQRKNKHPSPGARRWTNVRSHSGGKICLNTRCLPRLASFGPAVFVDTARAVILNVGPTGREKYVRTKRLSPIKSGRGGKKDEVERKDGEIIYVRDACTFNYYDSCVACVRGEEECECREKCWRAMKRRMGEGSTEAAERIISANDKFAD